MGHAHAPCLQGVAVRGRRALPGQGVPRAGDTPVTPPKPRLLGEEAADLLGAHLRRLALGVEEEDVAFDPPDVGLLRAQTIVARTQGGADAVVLTHIEAQMHTRLAAVTEEVAGDGLIITL